MSASLVGLLLYVPILFLALIIGIFYLTEGYKKGLWRSLVSLGATVISLAISMILSKITAKLLSGPIFKIIPIDSDESNVFYSFANEFIKGMIQVVLSLVFFVIFLFISLIVLKLIGRKLKYNKLDTDDKNLKWAGLGVRFVDTILVSLLLALPIYGALATYIPPVNEFYQMKNTANESDDISTYLDEIDDHIVVGIYKTGPMAWVFDGLSSFGVQGENINLSKIAEVLGGIIERFREITKGTEQERIDAIKELNDYIKDNVVEEKWSYKIVCAVSKSMEKYVDTIEDEKLKQELNKFILLFDMTEEEYKTNGLALLDFTSYALENDFIEFMQDKDYTLLTDEYYEKFGDLINSSKQAVALKRIILEDAAVELYYGIPLDRLNDDMVPIDYDDSESREKAKLFIDRYYGDGYVDKSDRAKEAMALTMIMFENGRLDLIEGFARHPLFGIESVDVFIDDQFLNRNRNYFFDEEELNSFYEANPELLILIKEKLAEIVELRPGEIEFEEYFDALLTTVYFTKGVSRQFIVEFDGKTLKTVLEIFGEDDFIDSDLIAGKEAYDFLTVMAENIDTAEKDPGEYFFVGQTDFGYLYNYIEAAKDTKYWPDVVFDEGAEYNESNMYDFDAYNAFVFCAENILGDRIFGETMADIVEQKGVDPWGLAANLTENEKQVFKTIVDDVCSYLCISDDDLVFYGDARERFEKNAQIYNENLLLNAKNLKALFGIE